jgi:hypothetical protein
MKKFITFLILVTIQMSAITAVSAIAFDSKDILDSFSEGITEQSSNSPDDQSAKGIVLPTYQEDLAGGTDGAQGIVSTIRRFLDIFKLIVAPVAVGFMIIMGGQMISAGRDNEEALTKGKNFLTYAVEGLILIFIADALIDVIFGPEGEVFRSGEAGAKEFGRQTSTLFQGMYSFVQVIAASAAVFMLIHASMRYIAMSYSDDQAAMAKREVTWSLVGLFVVGVSEFVVKGILFQDQGTAIGVKEANQLFAQLTNFLAGTIGTLSFAAFIYAGFLYLTARENEDNVAKAKKVIYGAVLGIILAMAAFAITDTLVELDTGR